MGILRSSTVSPANMTRRARILHLSCDFPDALVAAKTPAVANLVRAADAFDHFVYSLNRVSWRRGIEAVPFADNRVAVAYGAPPKGILLTVFLDRLAAFLLADIARRSLTFDVTHAHKLTIEGLVGERIADRLGVPFVCGIWGNTDAKLVRLRPDLRHRWRRVAAKARLLLPAAPWATDALERLLALDRTKVVPLPIMPTHDRLMRSAVTTPSLISVFNLDHWRNKGAAALVDAVARLRRKEPHLALDIFGGGGSRAIREAGRIIERAQAGAFVRLRGPLPNERVIETLNQYAALAMPSRRETFGLVYVEALFAGIPVLFSRGRGIDGYLPAEAIGYACNPRDQADIETGLHHLLRNQQRLKQSIGELQASGGLNAFTVAGIVRTYEAAISRALAGD